MATATPPSLITLALDAVKRELVRGNADFFHGVYELPGHLFDQLMTKLPPLTLRRLQSRTPWRDCDDYVVPNDDDDDDDDDGGGGDGDDDCRGSGRKRRRIGNFDAAWKALFKLRWPELADCTQSVDWQQIYWQTHLQNCLDEAAELALLPSFDGCTGELRISDDTLRSIGCEENMDYSNYSKLAYHCRKFGCYARSLRLQSVLCVAEICQLLRDSKLRSLVVRWVRSKEHVDGLCKLLMQNSETLVSLEFFHCKLSSTSVNSICDSLQIKSMQLHGIQNFSIYTSCFLETNSDSLPLGLASFLSSGRSLCSLKLCDNHIDQNLARMLLTALIDSSSSLSILDLSDNNISGWLSSFNRGSSSRLSSSLGVDKSLQSLRVLNIRGNNLLKDDMESLRYALMYIPNLEILDISDNPIEDDGIRFLVPYFVDPPEECSRLAELNVGNCELTSNGVTQLLDTLSALKRPLNTLSLADNGLGSQVAGALGKFLHTSIRTLNIGGIGLGSSGFQEIQKELTPELKLVEVDISKNRGGIATAKFLSKLLSLAPELVSINAAYNFMPPESIPIICSALKVVKGNLHRLDLTGNSWDYQPTHSSMLAEFQHNGRPILILPSTVIQEFPYDDDP